MAGKKGRTGKNRKYTENHKPLQGEKLEKAYKRLEKIEKNIGQGLIPENNKLRSLQEWHIDLIKDRHLFNWPYKRLAEKYDCSEIWAKIVCMSDVGIKTAREIINTPDVELIRNQLKWLSGSAFTVCKDVIEGNEREDSIEPLDRAKFALEVMKMAGVPEVKEHKFTFEHILKDAGKRIENAGKTVEAQIVEAEVKNIALDSEDS